MHPRGEVKVTTLNWRVECWLSILSRESVVQSKGDKKKWRRRLKTRQRCNPNMAAYDPVIKALVYAVAYSRISLSLYIKFWTVSCCFDYSCMSWTLCYWLPCLGKWVWACFNFKKGKNKNKNPKGTNWNGAEVTNRSGKSIVFSLSIKELDCINQDQNF